MIDKSESKLVDIPVFIVDGHMYGPASVRVPRRASGIRWIFIPGEGFTVARAPTFEFFKSRKEKRGRINPGTPSCFDPTPKCGKLCSMVTVSYMFKPGKGGRLTLFYSILNIRSDGAGVMPITVFSDWDPQLVIEPRT